MHIVKAPAKINLHLRVAPIGSDGFHPIMSWFCTVGLSDLLVCTPQRQDGITLDCKAANMHLQVPPADESNLILRAAKALQAEMTDAERRRCQGTAITLFKMIPMGGGLGGGSSDAASALVGLNQLWHLKWSRDRLAAIGARLGSDVPFFFFGPSSVCTGRGEQVRPIAPPTPRQVVMFLPPILMPTPQVFRQFDALGLGSDIAVAKQPDWGRWSQLSAKELLPLLVNDLEPAAFAISAQLREFRQHVEEVLGRPVRMSGSGSTLFTLFDLDEAPIDRMKQVKRLPGTQIHHGPLASPQMQEVHWHQVGLHQAT